MLTVLSGWTGASGAPAAPPVAQDSTCAAEPAIFRPPMRRKLNTSGRRASRNRVEVTRGFYAMNALVSPSFDGCSQYISSYGNRLA